MEAGRELDRLIGERVMGYTVNRVTKEGRDDCRYVLLDAQGRSEAEKRNLWAFRYMYRKNVDDAWDDCPHFSTDLRDAWRVVEKMRQHKEYRTLQLIAYSYNRTYATFVKARPRP